MFTTKASVVLFVVTISISYSLGGTSPGLWYSSSMDFVNSEEFRRLMESIERLPITANDNSKISRTWHFYDPKNNNLYNLHNVDDNVNFGSTDGSATIARNNEYNLSNVGGKVNFGSSVVSDGNTKNSKVSATDVQANNRYNLHNIKGTVDFGSKTIQRNNVYRNGKSTDNVNYGSLTILDNNEFDFSNLDKDTHIDFGSKTYQEGNTYA